LVDFNGIEGLGTLRECISKGPTAWANFQNSFIGAQGCTHDDAFTNEWITQENLAEALPLACDVFGVSGHCIVVSP
jgi:hypothetical protein